MAPGVPGVLLRSVRSQLGDLAVCFSLWMPHRQVSRVKVRLSDLDPTEEEVASRAGDEER